MTNFPIRDTRGRPGNRKLSKVAFERTKLGGCPSWGTKLLKNGGSPGPWADRIPALGAPQIPTEIPLEISVGGGVQFLTPKIGKST